MLHFDWQDCKKEEKEEGRKEQAEEGWRGEKEGRERKKGGSEKEGKELNVFSISYLDGPTIFFLASLIMNT